MKTYIASTHETEYLIHKYWARKPANVVKQFISQYANPNEYVLDPFCGSSVTNIEAAKLGINSIGIDINPVAALIGRVLSNDVSLEDVEKTYANFQSKVLRKLDQLYAFGASQIKYCTHLMILKCNGCGSTQESNGSVCRNCKKRINSNIGTLHSSKIVSITDSNGKECLDEKMLQNQTAKAQADYSEALKINTSIYDQKFLTNKRILSYEGTSTRSFYTNRAFSALTLMANFIHEITSEPVRNFFLLTLTATSTQASRLIPSRNGLTTGGPAWSVPGFWVAKKHLEYNPASTFDVRFRKTLAGVCSLKRKSMHKLSELEIVNGDCIKILSNAFLKKIKGKIGYVFTDPPYGDSVPYLEFSAIWNSWLKQSVSYSDEIIVSDSSARNKRWERYKLDIVQAINCIGKVLKTNGYFTVTFNQLSLDAWHTLIYSFENAKLTFHEVALILPAVIPSKARFSVSGSYLGDYYLTFQKSPQFCEKKSDRDLFERQLGSAYEQAAAKREGKLTYPHIIRITVGIILKKGYVAEAALWANELIGRLFLKKKDAFYLPNMKMASTSVNDAIDSAIKKILLEGNKSSWEIVSKIYEQYDFLEAPEISEILACLKFYSKRGDKHLQIERQELLFK